MASLTPGVLTKLLEQAGTGAKVAGEHRLPLLQVVGIVPRGGDPFLAAGARPGFLLKVSDSLHAAYVGVAGNDAELVADDRVGLGQFVRVAGLDIVANEAVPVLRGLCPLPRRRPCVGDPVEIFPTGYQRKVSPFSAKKPPSTPKKPLPLTDSAKKSPPFSEAKPRRRSMTSAAVDMKESRRLSLDSSSKKSLDLKLKKIVGKDDELSFKIFPGKTKNLGSKLSQKGHSCSSMPVELKMKIQNNNTPTTQVKVKMTNSNRSSPCKVESKKLGNGGEGDEMRSPRLVKVLVGHKNWDSSVQWDALSGSLATLGKGSIRRREAAFAIATVALQQAAASEIVVQSLSVFADLCRTTKGDSLQSLIERFLTLHKNLLRAEDMLNTMLKIRDYGAKLHRDTSQWPSADDNNLQSNRKSSAAEWINAALKTDLSSFTLFSKQDKKLLASKKNQHHCIVLDANLTRLNSKNNSSRLSRGPTLHHSATLPLKLDKPSRRNGMPDKVGNRQCEWLEGEGLKETAGLCKHLLSCSRDWFLKLLEDELDKGHGSKEDEILGISGVLGQLKMLNQWLEDATGEKFEVDANVERVRKKLYKFLLEHVDLVPVA